jgi:hypothetical protein
MNLVALVIQLSHGTPAFTAQMPERDALDILKKWQSRWYATKNVLNIDGLTADGVHWSVKADAVEMMYTITSERLAEAKAEREAQKMIQQAQLRQMGIVVPGQQGKQNFPWPPNQSGN